MDRMKTDATAKTAPKGCGKKRATAADRRVIALEAELADAKAAHVRRVDVFERSDADATNAQADPDSCKVRLVEVKQASKLASANLNDAQKQGVESAKAAKKAAQQPKKMSGQARLLEDEVTSLETQTSKCIKTHDFATSSSTK